MRGRGASVGTEEAPGPGDDVLQQLLAPEEVVTVLGGHVVQRCSPRLGRDRVERGLLLAGRVGGREVEVASACSTGSSRYHVATSCSG